MDLARLPVDLGRPAPHHHQPGEAALLAEAVDVRLDLLGEVPLALPLLDVLTGQLLHVDGVEHRGPRLDPLQERLHGREVLVVEDTRLAGGLVGVVAVDVPSRELELVQAGQGHELADARRAVVGPLAETDGPHLGEAADRPREPLADGLHARDEGRRHRAHAREQDAQLSFRGRDRSGLVGAVHDGLPWRLPREAPKSRHAITARTVAASRWQRARDSLPRERRGGERECARGGASVPRTPPS